MKTSKPFYDMEAIVLIIGFVFGVVVLYGRAFFLQMLKK